MKEISLKILLFILSTASFWGVAAKSNVVLEHAETLSFDKKQKADCQVLKGNVRFRHEGALLFCDSAYFYTNDNSFDAFGHVKMEQGDTLFAYGNTLKYDGNKQLLSLRGNVRLINRNMTLETETLDYNRVSNTAYYFNGGKLYDETNTLISKRGYYMANAHLSEFKDSVVLTNPDFHIFSDTLKYNLHSKEANIEGPSNIYYKDEAHIYSEKGRYNTELKNSTLYNRSIVTQKDGKSIVADTIFYNQITGDCRIRSNAVMIDSVQKIILKGNVGNANTNTSFALLTDSATVINYADADSLFMHADTIYCAKDSAFNNVYAYHNVRIYRTDLQGKCDSVAYTGRDSLITMYFAPVLWHENSQISGSRIQMHIDSSSIDRIKIQENALVAMQEDTLHFNQLLGREVTGFLEKNKLYRIDVKGNAESRFFPRDKDSLFIGMNKTASDYMTIYLKDNKLDRVLIYPSPTGTLSPLANLVHEDMFFPQFVWHEDVRPKSKDDIYRRTTPPVREEKKTDKKRRK